MAIRRCPGQPDSAVPGNDPYCQDWGMSMEKQNIFGFATDKGGRRKIKDRRYRIEALPFGQDRRTGLKRRRGLDRRLKQIKVSSPQDRRGI